MHACMWVCEACDEGKQIVDAIRRLLNSLCPTHTRAQMHAHIRTSMRTHTHTLACACTRGHAPCRVHSTHTTSSSRRLSRRCIAAPCPRPWRTASERQHRTETDVNAAIRSLHVVSCKRPLGRHSLPWRAACAARAVAQRRMSACRSIMCKLMHECKCHHALHVAACDAPPAPLR